MDSDKEIQKFNENLKKAVHNGEQGKYRRLKGKTVFIRSKDKKVTKGPNKGKRLLMKGAISADQYSDQVGEATSKVMLTQRKKKKKDCGCGCGENAAISKSIRENLDTILGYLESLNPERRGR